MNVDRHFAGFPTSRRLGLSAWIVLAGVVFVGCADRPLTIDAYAPCMDSEECAVEAVCANSGYVSACRPKCEADADCPHVDASAATCGLDGYAVGQCVIPGHNGCSDGMILVQADADPESPLVCAWES